MRTCFSALCYELEWKQVYNRSQGSTLLAGTIHVKRKEKPEKTNLNVFWKIIHLAENERKTVTCSFIRALKSKTASSVPPSNTTKSAFEPPKGILKSKSIGVGFMPMDLSSELKNRLKSSTHASVSNLRKSATTHNAARASDENVSALANSATSTSSGAIGPQHDDAVSLVRNLSNLGRPPLAGTSGSGASSLRGGDVIASTSEGESSGGREISEIIKNSAVARRRKLNDGGYSTKAKATSYFWPYQFKLQSTPSKLEQSDKKAKA
ncbi:unnamed protein product [Ceratitis capitata]|uniref:(Mediterranean fruit fly) hypothetical protein n=1 Tax=Ceratitis capitata TaxID=7213 RepID=A0A811V2Y0_CERCA|nr:unnamed protein product [Ceratitis capitata]